MDSFPGIYEHNQENTIGVRTSLTTSSEIGTWVRDLEAATKWRIGREERENFSNVLLEIGERYRNEEGSDDENWDD